MGEEFNPYYTWLAIPLDQQPPHHYRLLGVALFESSPDVIANAADQRMAFLRTFQSGPKSSLSQKLLNEIATARVVLLDPKRKVVYDQSLRAQLTLTAPPPAAALVPPPPPAMTPPDVQIGGGDAALWRRPTKKRKRNSPLMPLLTIVGLLAALGLVVLVFNAGRSPQSLAESNSADTNPPAAPRGAAASPAGGRSTALSGAATLSPTEGEADAGARDARSRPTAEPSAAMGRTDQDPRSAAEPSVDASSDARLSISKPEPDMPEPAEVSTKSEVISRAPRTAEQNPAPQSPGADAATDMPADTPKLPEPSAEALAAAHAQIKEVYRDELAASRPGAKRVLAESLLKLAELGRDEPAVRFQMYQQARLLAAESADVALALEAINSLTAAFDVDASALRVQTLLQLSKSVKTPEAQLAVGRAALENVNAAVQVDQLSSAEKLAALAQSMAVKIRDTELRKLAAARLIEVKKIEQQWKDVQPAIVALEKNSNDAAANLKYGSYLCLTHGDWKQGLPLLAKGGDGKLTSAARADLDQPDDVTAQMQLGDAWWHLAGEEKGLGKSLLFERACYWYRLALPHLTGLPQTRIEKRLQEATGHAPDESLGRRAPAAKLPKLLEIPLTAGDANSNVVLRLSLMPAGKFVAGSPAQEPGHQGFENPHEVVLTKPFFIGTTEVTQAQWRAVMGGNPSQFTGPDLPVHNIAYTDAKEFCQLLSELPANRDAYQFRLPTSAEWEYACRAGSRHAYGYGDDPAQLGQYAWYIQTTKGTGGPRPVGQLKPNAAGLYDMHGNVSEWCSDSFNDAAITTRQVDPKGLPGVNQITRGGNGMASAETCRCACLTSDPPGKSNSGLGFRVVCEVSSGRKK